MANENYSSNIYAAVLNRIITHRAYPYLVTFDIDGTPAPAPSVPDGVLVDANGDMFLDANGNYFVTANE